MTRLFVALVLLTKMRANDAVQPNAVVTAQPGDPVTLTCNSTSFVFTSVVWFRHVAGQNPQFILATYLSSSDYIFYGGFMETQRFTLQRKQSMFNLQISDVKASDAGFYYCALHGNKLDFHVGGSSLLMITAYTYNSMMVVQRPVSESVPPGDSVTLQCTVDSGICAGEHSVYWFRRGSGESLPGLIYTHGNRSVEAGSPTQSCVYSLPKSNLSRSDAGTYYCAVATCGEILFGNGTKLDTEGLPEHSMDAVILGLAVSLGFCVIWIIVLLTTRNTKFCDHCTVAASHVSHNDDEAKRSSDQNSDAENLNYAALRFADKKPENGRKKKELKEETLYSPVRQYWNETLDRMV